MKKLTVCECADSMCPEHNGEIKCRHQGVQVLYRIDMQDYYGTVFCLACANDAMKCGLFSDERN